MFVLFAFFLQSELQAQEIRSINGRSYIVHKVEAGQTLYAISRSYAVPVEALMASNPEAKDGLTIGQEILVPKDEVIKKEARNAPSMLADGELSHTVSRKETLFGISKQYGVEINVLLERNPELNSGLKAGMVVVIPVGKVEGQPEVVTRPALADTLIGYVVQPGETMYSIGKRYGVSPEALRSANGGMPDGLKAGDLIRIPMKPGSEYPEVIHVDSPVPPRRYRVGLLLPFATERNDSLLATAPYAPVYHEASRISAQFYAGALMALDTLKKLGLIADVSVIDMGDDQRTWNAALKRPELKEMDLFIGPFHRSAVEPLAQLNPRSHIVCPVPQSNKVILGNPTVSKVTPTRIDLIRQTARYVAMRHGKDNIILLKPDIYGDKEAQDQMAKSLQDAVANQSLLRDTLIVARPGRRDLGDLSSKLRKDRTNVLIAPSDDVEYVTSLVSKLRSIALEHRIVLVGLESWQNMETVAPSDLDLMGHLFARGSFIDQADPRTVTFIKEFRSRFSVDVDEYAFLGFDVTLYYVQALMMFGPDFPGRFDQVKCSPLHMGFRMVRTGPENGYRNEYAVMLLQRDLQVVKAP